MQSFEFPCFKLKEIFYLTYIYTCILDMSDALFWGARLIVSSRVSLLKNLIDLNPFKVLASMVIMTEGC